MEITSKIPVQAIAHSRLNEVDFNNLGFGQHIADHMLVCDYHNGSWQEPHIVPYGDMRLSPATLALHYGQTVFEGMKAFRTETGRINIFRPEKHYERFARSLERMCMQPLPYDVFVEGLAQLVHLDRGWVPAQEGSSLYIRPFMFASEEKFGVKISDEYRFIIFSGPVGPYYPQPLRVKVEQSYHRAANGGTGYAKCAGNYGGAFYPTELARREGYDQVIWTNDGFIEESGTMNLFFVINGILVTPPLGDTILDGVTRDSLLAVAKELGLSASEQPLHIDELVQHLQTGRVSEAFGAGTAAVVAPIQAIQADGWDYYLPAYSAASIHQQLKEKLHRIRTGRDMDIHGWNYLI